LIENHGIKKRVAEGILQMVNYIEIYQKAYALIFNISFCVTFVASPTVNQIYIKQGKNSGLST